MPYPNSSVPYPLRFNPWAHQKHLQNHQKQRLDSIPKLAHKMEPQIPAWFLTSWQRGSSWVCAWRPNSHHAAIDGMPSGPQTCFSKLRCKRESVVFFFNLPLTDRLWLPVSPKVVRGTWSHMWQNQRFGFINLETCLLFGVSSEPEQKGMQNPQTCSSTAFSGSYIE